MGCLYGALPAVIGLLILLAVNFDLLFVGVAIYGGLYWLAAWLMLAYFRSHGVLVGPQQYP